MKYSESWLREWINPLIDHEEFITQLTMAGFNVEKTQPVIKNKFYGIVIAEIIEYKTHPNLNNLWIIKVNIGNTKPINIVIDKYINYIKKMKIVIAKIGARLPNGKIIKSVFIKGEKSEGILCTFLELGLQCYNDDIIKLPEDAPIGCDFYNYMKLYDNIIDINITPNRGDCLSIMGLSREIAAINQLKLKKMNINTIDPVIPDAMSIIVHEPYACPKFLGKILKNIDANVSTPLKIQEKLRRCGICPINIITDITNYVLLELGHPIFIFDYEKINQNEIYIRFAKFGESLTLCDNNTQIKLSSDILIIADNSKPLAIAGITIGNQANISLKTCNIFLQVAYFNPLNILKLSKLNHLDTLSSIRYARGVDPNISELVLNYTTSLLIKYCHGYSGPTVNINNNYFLPKLRSIILTRVKLNTILGFHIPDQKVINILENLGFQIKIYNNYWRVLIPSWRFDINIEENLISEVIRIYGYNHIPQFPTKISLKKSHQKTNLIPLSRFKTILIDRGYQEIITYSFVNPNTQKLLHPQQIPLTLINPISTDMSVMRVSLWTGLIESVLYNQHRQYKHFQLFESGICFIPKDNNRKKISQKLMIAGVRSGLRNNEYWDSNNNTSIVDFYDIKGDVEAILNINSRHNNNIIFKKCTHPALHPGQSSEIYLNDIFSGYVGLIHPIIQDKLDLKEKILIFELSWNTISKFILPEITDISKFPKNYRDISLIISVHIPALFIINACKDINIKQLINIKLIDVYIGNNIPKGFKSLTIQLTLQSKTHTLQEQEIIKIVNLCETTLKRQFNAVIR